MIHTTRQAISFPIYSSILINSHLSGPYKFNYSIAGQHIAMREVCDTRFLITDHLGSVVAVTDDTGALVANSQQRYLPTIRQSEFMPETLESNHRLDNNTGDFGLMDYRSRWYASSLGRFTQPDTIVPDLANPQTLNRFSYVANNPINFTDPTGHKMQGECGGGDHCGNLDWSKEYANYIAAGGKTSTSNANLTGSNNSKDVVPGNAGRDLESGSIPKGPPYAPTSTPPAPDFQPPDLQDNPDSDERPRPPDLSLAEDFWDGVIDFGNEIINADWFNDNWKHVRYGANLKYLEAIVQGVLQWNADSWWPKTISPEQRIARATIVGVEALATDWVADKAGKITGVFLGAPGDVSANYLASGYADIFWRKINAATWPHANLGIPTYVK